MTKNKYKKLSDKRLLKRKMIFKGVFIFSSIMLLLAFLVSFYSVRIPKYALIKNLPKFDYLELQIFLIVLSSYSLKNWNALKKEVKRRG